MALKIVRDRLERLEDIPDNLQDEFEAIERTLLRRLERLIGELDSYNGLLLPSNAAQIENILNELRQLYEASINPSLISFGREFREQQGLIVEYMESAFSGGVEAAVLDSIRDAYVSSALSGVDAVYATQINERLRGFLIDAIVSGQSIRDTINGLESVSLNFNGRAGTIVRTAYAQSDRAIGLETAKQLDAEYFEYSGGRVQDTREFCLERDGKIFSLEEIRGWGRGERCCGLSWPKEEEWQGQIKGTNEETILTNLGGWQCLHSLIAVPESDVPKDVLER